MGATVKVASLSDEGDLGPVAEINVTPLVDVMLVLLIIFMVTAPLMMSQLPIALPKPSLVPSDQPAQKITVDFDLQNQYYIQTNDDPKEAVVYTELPQRLRSIAAENPNELITVCADKDSVYDRVVDLMSVVGEAGFSKVSLCP
ncbi:MAG: protein TolR [Hydrocarboniphaga sp.]|uniref:biopolymer transporter ExbD n=1 Tax=Hydrocarboniphaga sp. TaxID=2033016 RepID=UPI002608AE61|nr:biopolymer transporter ExbD [Hydrocarboniphaga sp.]MDB5970473.1 protein TolR [Hydrocarboniphaga sp.]